MRCKRDTAYRFNLFFIEYYLGENENFIKANNISETFQIIMLKNGRNKTNNKNLTVFSHLGWTRVAPMVLREVQQKWNLSPINIYGSFFFIFGGWRCHRRLKSKKGHGTSATILLCPEWCWKAGTHEELVRLTPRGVTTVIATSTRLADFHAVGFCYNRRFFNVLNLLSSLNLLSLLLWRNK